MHRQLEGWPCARAVYIARRVTLTRDFIWEWKGALKRRSRWLLRSDHK